jgi:large subunit ribosomal protein L25
MKSGIGVLLQEMDSLSIRCLPTQLFQRITVDVSQLKVDDTIYVRDLPVPEGIEVLDAAGDVVVRLTRFVEEKVEEVVAEAPEVEVIEKGKKEEEEAGEEA